jgi:multidrug efflux pump subunit AcrA (membrane-fusion protein)
MKFIYFLATFLLLISCSEERETTKPKQELMVEAVYSSVTIQPNQEYKVNASIAGYLDEVKVKEGDKVKLGDVLFVISNQSVLLNQRNSELSYDLVKDSYQGKANVIDEMKVDLNSAKLKMTNDSINAARISTLFAKNVASKSELEAATIAYELSKNNYSILKNKIIRKEQELKNQLNQSKNNVDASASKTGDYIIRSNINGKIFQLNKEKGEFVSMQETIAIVGDGSQFSIDMLIDEVDISKVDVGQKVLVTLEAYKDKVFEAYITEIAPKMDERTQTFKIKANFKNVPKKLYMGLTGEGNIVINEKKKALVIPKDYLLPGNQVETENGIVKVKTGLSNWDFVEILSGINQNTIIYKPKE